MNTPVIPRMLIHVGLPKTGTTSLQVGFRDADSIEYIYNPAVPMPQSREFSNAVGVGKDEIAQAVRPAWRVDFPIRMRQISKPIVISDETLSQVSHIDWSAFEAMLKKIEGEIVIVLVLRPFFSWLESLFNQFAKKGRTRILAFDPDSAEKLNAYDINFQTIHAGYSDLARRLGSRCQLKVLPYSRSVNRQIYDMCGVSPDYLEAAGTLNPSPSGWEAMAAFLKQNDVPAEGLPVQSDRLCFLGYDEVDRLHRRHGPWMAELTEALGWPRDAIDDVETFRAKTSGTSFLKIGAALMDAAGRPYGSADDMAAGEGAGMSDARKNNRKIKGVLARALLRAEMRMEQGEGVSEEDFQALWTSRKEQLLETAAHIRQSLRRQGFDLQEYEDGEAPAAGENLKTE